MSTTTEELSTIREGAALSELAGHAVIEVRGRHSERFLHAMLSQDVRTMGVGEARLATLLTDTGKVVSDLVLVRRDGSYLALVGPGLADVVLPALTRFVLAQDVKLAVLPLAALTVQGPRTPAVISAASGVPYDVESAFETRSLSIAATPAIVVEHTRSGERGVDLLVPCESVAAIRAALIGSGATSIDHDALEAARIEAGIPRMGAELDDTVIPLEAGLRHAVSYKKGCYIGQEVIAMMTYRGQAPRRLMGLVLPEGPPPERGTVLRAAGRKAGIVTSSTAASTHGAAIALALVKTRNAEPGAELTLGEGDPPRLARVVALPFHWGTGLLPSPVDE